MHERCDAGVVQPQRELHRHPYPEVFTVDAGQGDFQIEDTHLTVTAGDIVTAPAGAAHRFTSVGDEHLRLTAIHTASTMDTEWLTALPIRTPADRSDMVTEIGTGPLVEADQAGRQPIARRSAVAAAAASTTT